MSTEEFISAIKANEILWNSNHKSFNNSRQKVKIWEDVAKQFNLSIDECRRKWKSLRSTFSRQNHRAIDKDSPPGIVKYDKEMDFLIPLINKNSTLLVDNKQYDNSSDSSIESDMEASPLDPIEANPENRTKSTAKSHQIPEFIEEVKQRLFLWNVNDPNFKNREIRDDAWKEIESKLGINVESCKRKWKYLKAYLVRESVKHPDNKSTWPYFKQLEFVRPHIQSVNIKPIVDQDYSRYALSSASSEVRNDFPELVIAEVKKYPLLWNLCNKNYKSVYKKLKTWRKIAKSLESTVDEVKKKWKALRDLFARSYVKNPDENTNNWIYFKQMIFLAPYLKCRNLSYAKSFEQTIETDDDESMSSVLWESDNNENKTENQSGVVNELSIDKLIEEIQKQQILWDPNYNNYKNVKLRCVAWKIVADNVGFSVVECRKKWKALRDLFVRNYLRPIKEEDKHWKYYGQMKFLGPSLKEKKDELVASQRPTSEISVANIKIEPIENSVSSCEEPQPDDEKDSRIFSELDLNDFIDVVKQHDVLWNLSNTNYRNQELRLKAWEQIADHFSLSNFDECKKKWKALRDAFARTYYRPVKEEEKVWKYYKQMTFLVPNLRCKKGANNIDESESEYEFGNTELENKQEEKEEKEDEDENLSAAFEELDRHDNELKSVEKFCIEDFIDVIKQHEIIWNSNNDNYRNNDLRNKEWEEIAVHFNTSVEECKKKWKALRDSFVRNYFKPIKEKYKAWNHYNQLKFLGPHVKYKRGKNLVGDSEFKRQNGDSFSSSNEDTQNDEMQLSNPHISKKFTVKEFVNEIKKHTILWDLSDERCKIKKYRLQAWKEISAHFSVSSLECKRKWATLRSAFIREFAKYPDNDTWGNFKELDFLLPYLKANVSANNELSTSETTFHLDVAKIEPKDNVIPFESYEMNSENVDCTDENWMDNFILAVKQQKILWDSTDSNYKNSLKRQQAWNMIAKQFGLSIDDSKEKWKSLREIFAAHLNNHCGEDEDASRWIYFNAMKFLLPHLKEKKFGEMGYEASNDSDSFGVRFMKSQASETTVDENSEIEFIEAVKGKPLLWNWSEDDHKDNVKKEYAWEEIASKFSSTIADCKERWQALQNGYTRVILSYSMDRKCSWKYLEEMDFLRPFIKSQTDPPNIEEASELVVFNEDFLDQKMVSKDEDQDDALYEELFECCPSEFTLNIERNDIQKPNTCQRTAVKRRKNSDTSSDDEDKEFYENMREKMKTLPSDVKSEAKGHIQAYLKVVAANHSL